MRSTSQSRCHQLKYAHDCCSPHSWHTLHDPLLRGPAATHSTLTRVSSGSLASHPTPREPREFLLCSIEYVGNVAIYCATPISSMSGRLKQSASSAHK